MHVRTKEQYSIKASQCGNRLQPSFQWHHSTELSAQICTSVHVEHSVNMEPRDSGFSQPRGREEEGGFSGGWGQKFSVRLRFSP